MSMSRVVEIVSMCSHTSPALLSHASTKVIVSSAIASASVGVSGVPSLAK